MGHRQPGSVRELAHEQKLGVLSACSLPTQPGRYHPRRVDHQQVARRNQCGQIAKVQVLRLARRAVEDKQPARRSIRQWMLGDLRAGEIVVEVRETVH